jgi:hypothetical protein
MAPATKREEGEDFIHDEAGGLPAPLFLVAAQRAVEPKTERARDRDDENMSDVIDETMVPSRVADLIDAHHHADEGRCSFRQSRC